MFSFLFFVKCNKAEKLIGPVTHYSSMVSLNSACQSLISYIIRHCLITIGRYGYTQVGQKVTSFWYLSFLCC